MIGVFELMAKAGVGPAFRHQGDRVFAAGWPRGLAALVKRVKLME